MVKKDLASKFEERIKKLEETLPKLEGEKNCAALTLTNVVDVLGISEVNSFYFNNLAVPLGGGFGGFKSIKGWKGPCGAVSGGCAAIGIILGGRERLKLKNHLKAYQKAAIFTHYFEKEFGSVACQELSGTDFYDVSSVNEYLSNKVWEKKCYKYVIFALDQIRKLMVFELKNKWA
ncbi:MAG: C-GCAxxG-C-C family protein [Candidatus Hodarchaeota archaeon]